MAEQEDNLLIRNDFCYGANGFGHLTEEGGKGRDQSILD